MDVLMIGLGSIGTRHLKNLRALAARRGLPLRVTALRSGHRALPEETAALVDRQIFEPGALGQYDAAFITNPTSMHFDALRLVRGRADALFIEKPIFDDPGRSLADCLAPGQRAYVAAPMRWCGTMMALRELLPSLRVYSARVICSSYLPEWRPGVDYRTVYSAHRDMGGGVTIDLIHEWDYLVELFGRPLEVYNFKGHYSELELDSDDVSVYIARWPQMLGEVHLDYFGRTYRRTIELMCPDGTVTADFGAGTLTLADGTVRSFPEPVNERYVREMDYFITYALTGRGESVNTPSTALDVLKITLGEVQ